MIDFDDRKSEVRKIGQWILRKDLGPPCLSLVVQSSGRSADRSTTTGYRTLEKSGVWVSVAII